MSVNFHPLDFDAIKKGDAWTVEQMEQLVGHPSTSKKYELAVLQLANRIEREMAMRNRPATVAVLKGVLRVLNDSEAAVHTAKQFQSGKRKLYRNLQRGLQVDRSQLTTEEAQSHDRNLIIQGKIVAAVKSTVRLAVAAHKRQTPGLPEPVAVDE